MTDYPAITPAELAELDQGQAVLNRTIDQFVKMYNKGVSEGAPGVQVTCDLATWFTTRYPAMTISALLATAISRIEVKNEPTG